MVRNPALTHMKVVVGEAVIASSAATFSAVLLEAPVWAMFVGWISFFTRGLVNLKQGAINLACVLIGLVLGMGAAHALAVLTPLLGEYAVSAVVFVITGAVLSLAKAPVFNNLLGFFLGLVAYFAYHQPPSVSKFALLAVAATLGATAAFLAHALQARIRARAAA